MDVYKPNWSLTRSICKDVTVNLFCYLIWSICVLLLIKSIAHVPEAIGTDSALEEIDIVMTIVFSPIVESFLLSKMLDGLLRTKLSVQFITVFCAIFWALLHGWLEPVWAATTLCSFYLMSRLYIKYKAVSPASGFMAILTMHVLMNTTAVYLQVA